MYRISKFLFLLGVCMTLSSCTAFSKQKSLDGLSQAREFAPIEKAQVTTLPNGLTVLIKEDDRFPLANIRLFVHAGAAYEKQGQEGISHLLEHMVFKGTKKRAPGESARAIESVGGSLNAGTSWDYTVYYVEVPDTQWQLGLDVVTDMAFNPTISPKELASEKKVVLAELERGEDQPGSKLFKTLCSMVFKGSHYEWPIIGYRDTVEAITARDIHKYVDQLYQPQSMLLVVTGKVDEKQVLAEAEKLLGTQKNTHNILQQTIRPLTPKQKQAQIQIVQGQWNKAYFGMAVPIPDFNDSQSVGLEVLSHLLGGDDTSLLYRKFKYEKRLVDSIDASAVSLQGAGMLYISATLEPDKVLPFWDALTTELAHLSLDIFSEQELARSKLNLADSLFTAKETLSGMASKLGFFQFFFGSQQEESNYLYELSQIDRADLQNLKDRFLQPDVLSSCLLLPEGTELSEKKLREKLHATWPHTPQSTKQKLNKSSQNIQEITLPGNSTLVLLPDTTLPYTALSIYWPGGDGLISASKQGLPTLAASVLTRGTSSMNATEIEDFISDRAASVAASAGRDSFSFNAKFPAWFSDDLLPLFTDMLTCPTWTDKETELSKQDQIASIKMREDQALGLAFRHIFPFLFNSAPYSYYHRGSIENISQFSPEDIHRFWKNQASTPFVCAVCGQFDSENIQKFATQLALSLSKKESTYTYTSPSWAAQKEKILHLPDRNQAHVLAIFPTSGSEDIQSSAELTLLRAALAGQSGLLFRDLRDKQGLGYTVTAFLWQAPQTGFMTFYAGTDPSRVQEAKQGFIDALQSLRQKPLSAQEIERAKNVIRGEYYQEHQSLLSRSRQAASLMSQGFHRDRERILVETCQSLNADNIHELVQKYFDWDKAYIMEVRP